MYYTYALSSKIKNYIYVGTSDNPIRRISHHNKGYNRTTKSYRPFKTLLIKSFKTRIKARKHEKYLKSGSGKEYLKLLKSISGYREKILNIMPGWRNW